MSEYMVIGKSPGRKWYWIAGVETKEDGEENVSFLREQFNDPATYEYKVIKTEEWRNMSPEERFME